MTYTQKWPTAGGAVLTFTTAAITSVADNDDFLRGGFQGELLNDDFGRSREYGF